MTDGYTAEELRDLLEGGALVSGSITDRAAIHVLHSVGLIGQRFLDRYISIESVEFGGEQMNAAFIRDWSALAHPEDDFPFLTLTEQRGLELAACVALSAICRSTADGIGVEPPEWIHVCNQWLG
ncbi:hypothetical protein ABZ942_36530 [Nocardia sp. NPDC046473]|uniref:hypothetical protein n=1 Tax=Nocardia sp. NPDC046473 TaxID=3155733 RepID=UPI0034029F07